MSLRLQAALQGSLKKIVARENKAAERAVTLGVRQATDGLKYALRGQVTGAGLGNRLANTWRGKVFPQGQASMNAAGFVWSKAPQIISTFDQGVLIHAKGGAYLPIPLPAAGKLAGRRKLTPKNWEKANGQQLVFIKRKGGNNPLLVAENMRVRTGKRGGFAKASKTALRTGRGLTTVPLFVLVPQVSITKRFSIKPLENKWHAALPRLVVQNWQEIAEK